MRKSDLAATLGTDRRAVLLGGASAATVALARCHGPATPAFAATGLPETPTEAIWRAALSRYWSAFVAFETAWDAMKAAQENYAAWRLAQAEPLQLTVSIPRRKLVAARRRFKLDELCDRECDASDAFAAALADLLATPAPDLEAARQKVALIIQHEHAREEAHLSQVHADLERLATGGARHA